MNDRVASLHPAFRPIVEEVLHRAPERGIHPFVSQGRRAPEYQACLYAQGRLGIGKSATYAGHFVTASLSKDGKSVIASCGKLSNVVPLKKWSAQVTKVGPYGSWHTLGLAVDFSFHSTAASRDDMIVDLEEAIATARKGGDAKRAAQFYGVIDKQYASLAQVWDAVAPDAIWGNDWDDDGILNGPDPDNEWTDLPHFEFHPGIPSISRITPEQRLAILAGTLPAVPKQCTVCRGFSPIAIDGACRKCHDTLKTGAAR